MPCPLVHPFASFVPKPTRNPDIQKPMKERSLRYDEDSSKKIEEYEGNIDLYNADVNTIPKRKERL